MKFSNLEKGQHTKNVMLTKIEEKISKAGNTFFTLELSDGEEKVSAVCFDNIDNFKVGDLVLIVFTKSEYNGADNYRVDYIDYIEDENVNREDFVIAPPVLSRDMYSYIYNVLENLQNKDISKLSTEIYKQHKEKLLYWSAAKSHHHNLYAGLLYHTYRMVELAVSMADVYNNANRDLLIAGCALHDIGKLQELNTDISGNADYSVDGNLFGHLYIGAEMLQEVATDLNIDREVVRNLKHIILSHHNNPEWGAVVKPATMEAWLVSQIDMIDSQFYVFETESSKIQGGETSNSFSLDGKRIYKANIE